MLELNPGEEIVYKAKIHRFCYVFPGLLLGLGLLLSFPPDFQPNPASPFYELGQKIAHARDVLKGLFSPDVWSFFVTFQLLRTNYLSLLLITLGVIRLVYAFSYRNCSRYWVTNKRVLAQTSVFHNDVQEILLERLGHVRIYYGSIGKMIGRGMVVVSDNGMREIELRNLSKPQHYRHAILTALQLRRAERAKAKPKTSS